MYKGINMIANKGLGFKLINFMRFGESVFSIGFIEKTVKVDLHVRFNRAYPQRKRPQKVPEDSRRLHTEAEGEAPPRPNLQAGRPLGPACQPLVVMPVLHRLLDCIYAVYSSRFDLRAQD